MKSQFLEHGLFQLWKSYKVNSVGAISQLLHNARVLIVSKSVLLYMIEDKKYRTIKIDKQ